MKATMLNFDQGMQRRERPIPIVFSSNAYAVWMWPSQHRPKIGDVEGDEDQGNGL